MMNNQFHITTHPAFFAPIFCIDVNEDFSFLQQLQTEIKFRKIFKDGENNSYGSENLNVLEVFPKEKNTLMDYFNFIKDNFFHYKNTEFKMTTSWITKTPYMGYSNVHTHANSFMSGVFYYDEYEKETSPIIFERFNFPSSNFQITSEQTNELTCSNYTIFPNKNLLVLFPSYLYHRIGFNNSKKDRYSLAFNIIPQGKFGMDDSALEI